MSSIFHYTDAAGLAGILTSENLFASDYRFLNDASELRIIRDLLLPVFEAEIAEIMPELKERNWLRGFYEFHGTSGHRAQAEGFFESLLRVVNEISPLFVKSFCKHAKDSDDYKNGLLSQWRGYGNLGGFAIEFDEVEFDKRLKSEHDSYAYAGFKSDVVLYDHYDELFNPQHFKGLAAEMIRRIFEPHIDVSEVTGTTNFDAFVPIFMQVAPFLKHWGFREEREHRVLFSCFAPDKIPEEVSREPKKIKFRAKGGQLVPYIEVLWDLPIRSIMWDRIHLRSCSTKRPDCLSKKRGSTLKFVSPKYRFADNFVRPLLLGTVGSRA
jgi:hypothetical protein